MAIAPKSDPAQSQPLPLENATADFSQDSLHVGGAIDGNDQTGWAISPQFGKAHEATFETKDSAGHDGGSTLTITISQQYADGKHLLGKFRLSVTDGTRPLTKPKLPEAVAAAVAMPKDQRTAEQTAAIAAHHRTLDPELTRLTAEVKTFAAGAPQSDDITMLAVRYLG